MDYTCMTRTTRKCGFSISERQKSVWSETRPKLRFWL